MVELWRRLYRPGSAVVATAITAAIVRELQYQLRAWPYSVVEGLVASIGLEPGIVAAVAVVLTAFVASVTVVASQLAHLASVTEHLVASAAHLATVQVELGATTVEQMPVAFAVGVNWHPFYCFEPVIDKSTVFLSLYGS